MFDTSLKTAISLVLWTIILLYGASSLFWLLEVTLLGYHWQADDERAVPLEDIQVRILTFDILLRV